MGSVDWNDVNVLRKLPDGWYSVPSDSEYGKMINKDSDIKYNDSVEKAKKRHEVIFVGISQAQADARYVEKAKLTLGEWMDTFDEVNFVDYNWSKHVKKSTITSECNIEIRVGSFVTDMSISQLLKHKL